MLRWLRSFIVDPHHTKGGFSTLCTVALVVMALGVLMGSWRLGELRAAQSAEKKRINMVGWRSIPDAPKPTHVMVLEDTVSKSEFLLVFHNGDVVMSVIPRSPVEGSPSPDNSILPTSIPFKSSW